MGYLTVSEFVERYGEFEVRDLSQVGGDRTEVDPEVVRIAGAIDAASAEIDGRLAVEFCVPFSQVPHEVADICGAIARERLDTHDRRESVTIDATDARRRLNEIANRERILTLPSGAIVGSSLATFGGVERIRRDGWQDDRGLPYGTNHAWWRQ